MRTTASSTVSQRQKVPVHQKINGALSSVIDRAILKYKKWRNLWGLLISAIVHFSVSSNLVASLLIYTISAMFSVVTEKIDMSTVVRTNELDVYKVIDAAAETVRNYNADCISSPVIATSGPGTDSTTSRNDWCGLYTQFKSAHTLGTIPYRWEHSGTTVAALVKVTIHSPIRIAVLDGTFWRNGNISGQTKADMAKQQLGVPPNEPLVTYLGRSNTALLVWETAEEPELIFSHDLFAGLHSSEDCLALFQRHDCRPVTSRWRNFKNHQWKLWQDVGQDCLLEIPDLSFDCILDGTNN